MSVVSSRVSSIASILKTPGARNTLVGVQKKITFKLPPDLKSILIQLEPNKNSAKFEELKNIIRHSQIKDDDFIQLFTVVRECIPSLKAMNINTKSFVEILLNIEWQTRSSEAIILYKKFIDDLIDVHPIYYKSVIDKLIMKLKPTEDSKEWKGTECPREELDKLNHIHDIFQTILKNRPLLTDFLVSSLAHAYPHSTCGVHTHKVYLLALLQIIEYAPTLRRDILFLIIKRLTNLDVNVPPSEIHYCEQEDEDMEQDVDSYDADASAIASEKQKIEMTRQLICTLDVCMEDMFHYIHKTCYDGDKLNMNSLKSLLHDLIYCFDKIILPTHGSHHIQFIMFYICSFKTSVLDAFVRFLWLKVSDPNTPAIIRQYAITYISSLLARSKNTSLSLLHDVITEMTNWIHSYIQQDNSQNVNNDIRAHIVFYTICQSLFYLIAFRNRDLTDGKKNLMFLQNLQLTKIVTCKLNPLKVCQPAVVQNFAAVSRNYQLAYCYTVIEHNTRAYLPTLDCNTGLLLGTIFPFDPYLLKLSKKRISNIYYICQTNSLSTSEPVKTTSPQNSVEYDEDDFMEESFTQVDSLNNSMDKFSYGSSPGFCNKYDQSVNSQLLFINKEY